MITSQQPVLDKVLRLLEELDLSRETKDEIIYAAKEYHNPTKQNMITHTQPKISGLIHAFEEILHSTITEDYKFKLLAKIEKDLAQIGYHAAILGKQTLQKFYQDSVDLIIDQEMFPEEITQETALRVRTMKYEIECLSIDIETLEALQKRPASSDPVYSSLDNIIDQNSTIEGGQLMTFIDTRKGVMLFPYLDNGILLTKKQLEQLGSLIDQYKPTGPANGKVSDNQ